MHPIQRLVGVLLGVLAVALPGSAVCQDTLRTKDGLVEIIGLKTWTPRMLGDSLAAGAAGMTPFTPGCIKALTGRLHFTAAAMDRYGDPDRTGTIDAVLIKVVERQDSARIRFRPSFAGSAVDRPEWSDLLAATSNPGGGMSELPLMIALQTYPQWRRDSLAAADAIKRFPQADARVVPFMRTLAKHGSAGEHALALRTLEEDGNRQNRILALAVLLNHPELDGTWHALVRGLRDPDASVQVFSEMELMQLEWAHARPVDWHPVAADLRYILDGTNLAALTTVLRALAETSVSPDLAPALLGRGGGELVLQQAGVLHVRSREAAQDFLRTISRRECAGEVSCWARWRAALPDPRAPGSP